MPVSLQAGIHKFGPDNAALRVKTGRQGAAAKAGHDLVVDVTSWGATLDVGEDRRHVSVELNADPDSLRIREGTGGVQPLSDEDRADIQRVEVVSMSGDEAVVQECFVDDGLVVRRSNGEVLRDDIVTYNVRQLRKAGE